jgi:hypothetical protein
MYNFVVVIVCFRFQATIKHRRYLLSNNLQLTESQIFQLQDEQFATWFRTHVSPSTNSLSLVM